MFGSNILTSGANGLSSNYLGNQSVSHLSLSAAALVNPDKVEVANDSLRAGFVARGSSTGHRQTEKSFAYGCDSSGARGATSGTKRLRDVAEEIRFDNGLPPIAKCFFHSDRNGAPANERGALKALVDELSKPCNRGFPVIVEAVDRLLRHETTLKSLVPIFLENGIRIYDRFGPIEAERLRQEAAKAVSVYARKYSVAAE